MLRPWRPQTATTMVSFPGRLFIPETRPYRHDRDRMVQVLHEGRVRAPAPPPRVASPGMAATAGRSRR